MNHYPTSGVLRTRRRCSAMWCMSRRMELRQRWRSHCNLSAMKVTGGRGCWITSRVRSTRRHQPSRSPDPERIYSPTAMPLPGQSADGLAKCMPFWRARRRIPRSPPKLLMTATLPNGQRKRSNAVKGGRGHRRADVAREQDQNVHRAGTGRPVSQQPCVRWAIRHGNADDPHSRRLSFGPGSGRQR